jgi:hypothetical protein
MRLRALALLLVALVLSGLHPVSAGAESASGHLSGVVRDDKGSVLAGSKVRLYDGSGLLAGSDTADSSGRYSVHVQPGSYDLTVSEGDRVGRLEDVVVGGDTVLHLVVPRPYVTLSGTLRDAAGQPLRGMRVYAGGQRFRATTDAQGRFELFVLRDTKGVSVENATDDGYFAIGVDDFEFSRDRQLDLTVAFSTISVSVRDERDAPIAAAPINTSSSYGKSCGDACPAGFELFSGAKDTWTQWRFHTSSDADGRAAVRGLVGDGYLTVNRPWKAPLGVYGRPVTLPQADPIDVVLPDAAVPTPLPTVTLEGTLVDADGEPLDDATVSLEKDRLTDFYDHTNDDGMFHIEAPPGHYTLRISADIGTYEDLEDSHDHEAGLFVRVPDFDLTADRTQDLTVPVTSFSVRVIDRAGQPVRTRVRGVSGAGGTARVELFPRGVGTGSLSNNPVTDANGEATLRVFSGAPPVEVWAGWPTLLGSAEVEPGAGSVTVTLSAVTLSGTVRDARGPLTGDSQESAWVGFSSWNRESLDAEAAYELQRLPGLYRLHVTNGETDHDNGGQVPTATLPGWWGFEADYELVEDTLLDFTLPDGAPVDFVAAGADGQLLAGQLILEGTSQDTVDLAPGFRAQGWVKNEVSDEAGRFRPLIFGPSDATGWFRGDEGLAYHFTMPLTPGERVAILLAERVPPAPPGSPSDVKVSDNDGAATLTWSPPQEDGGGSIKSYVITASHSDTPVSKAVVPASARSATLQGLTRGKVHRFSVSAANSKGTGQAAQIDHEMAMETPTTTTPPSPGGPALARSGYWMVGSDGKVYPFGDAKHLGEPTSGLGSAEAVDLEPTSSGSGYRVLDERGRVYAYGDAVDLGDASLTPGEKATSLSASSKGYWLFTDKGRAIAFGDAKHFGDMAGTRLNGPVHDSVATPSGKGYYMVASDGGVFTFGDAVFAGSMGGKKLNAPVQSLVPDGDGDGYWLVASDGGIFAFEAPFRGSMGGTRLNRPVTGMVRFGNGYLMVGEDGGIFNFTDKSFHGSLGDNPPANPVVAVAALS